MKNFPNRQYYVYILTTSKNTALYTGITNDLIRRVYEHKHNLVEGFTKRYQVHKLVYYDYVEDVIAAIEREKQIKSWVRQKKIKLINTFNPDWHDLYDEILG
ncbi:MAG: excinuclease ABC subunit C [Chloroflexi bacterium RBG_16_50_11]|nr:MAG: excinuclease ABC subunit C [Chloroflexi bacterium RBG_16_50_11]